MPRRHLRLTAPTDATDVLAAFRQVRAELEIPPAFEPAALAEAERASRTASGPDAGSVPEAWAPGAATRTDLRDVPFVTVDPPGSMDLDQAVHVERDGDGFAVRYAIADVAAFVRPGGALDAEAHSRGTTLYAPDGRTPLHPPALSEGAASLLPDVDRPAVVWRIAVDAGGEITDAEVRRGLVRSRARLTYAGAQAALDDGSAPELLRLLREVGLLRVARERERGGVSLQVPEQEIVVLPDGSFATEVRRTLPVEEWNAQISLLTGIAAARIMREGGVGILRTLPPADPRDLDRLRRTAAALGIDWPDGASYADVLAARDADRPRDAAFLVEATALFRGAAYVPFGGTGQDGGVPDGVAHAAIAAEYAHVTAPLRRLVDRYGTEVCLALCAGEPVPAWVRDALPGLPQTMAAASRRSGAYDRATLDIVEAALLTGRVGELFRGVVVDVDPRPRPDPQGSGGEVRRGQLQVAVPAVRAPIVAAALPLGDAVEARLAVASVAERRVLFALGEPGSPAGSRMGSAAGGA